MKKSVLYIEDEEDYQFLVRRILTKAGWTVRTADTGQAGMAALHEERPSLLLLDINLPDTDGYSICRQLREDSAFDDLPVLMLTVRRRPDEWLKGFSAGANDYLSKPFDPAGLIARVKEGLEGTTLRLSRDKTPEYQLIQAAVGGNRAAFEVLIHKYKDRFRESMLKLVRTAQEVDDIIAYAFVTAFERLNEFKGQSSFYTWLYSIAVNRVLMSRRDDTPVASLDALQEAHPAVMDSWAEEDPSLSSLTRQENHEQMITALQSLSPIYRTILRLHMVEGMAYDQIATRLKIPIGTVMSRLHKARGLFQQAWNNSSATTVKS